MVRVSTLMAIVTSLAALPAAAKEMPTSNGPTLLSQAQAQNQYSAPSSGSSGAGAAGITTETPAQMFASQLQSQMLSSLSTQVNNAIFGANAAPSGTFVYGTQTITYTKTLSAINVTIADSSTGQTTQIQVPLVQVSQ